MKKMRRSVLGGEVGLGHGKENEGRSLRAHGLETDGRGEAPGRQASGRALTQGPEVELYCCKHRQETEYYKL